MREGGLAVMLLFSIPYLAFPRWDRALDAASAVLLRRYLLAWYAIRRPALTRAGEVS